MQRGSTSLLERAREIFDDLGYAVSGDGPEFSATRGWREVAVTTVVGAVEPPRDGTLRCFVAWHDDAAALQRRIAGADPGYEWALIGVDADGGYEVVRAPPA